MSSLDGWTIALVLVVVYAVVLLILYKLRWIGPERALSLYGPALMLKTKRGRDALDRIGRARRFWTIAADVGIALAALSMVTIVVVLALDAVVALQIPASAAPSPQEALGIPGINPIIPVGYGLIALVLGVVLHELAHGIVARSQGIGVRSLGILWLVIPIGAFVEQDDDDMTKAPRRKRDRVAAAGILANFVIAIVCFTALSAVVATSVEPNANGVGIGYVVPGTPAANASLAPGDIITAVNGTPTTTNSELLALLGSTHPNETVVLTYYSASDHALLNRSVTLTSLASYTHNTADRDRGFLGVSPAFLTPGQLRQELIFPPATTSNPLLGLTDWIVLPLAGLEPVGGTTVSFYHLSGPFSGTDPGAFWVGANILYWLAWMNILLGMSNALPLFPLDGGLLFRDFAASVAARLRRGWDSARLDRFGARAAAVASLAVLFLLAWQFVAPRL